MSGVALKTVLDKRIRVKIEIIKMKITMNTMKAKEDIPKMKTHS